MLQDYFHQLVSGRKKGFSAALLRILCAVIAISYSLIIRLRNLLYDKRIIKAYHAPAIVLSVGNITTGGTGKTPFVIWLCNLLHSKQIRSAVLTRGYKTDSPNTTVNIEEEKKLSDEPAVITQNCPETKVIINPDRTAGAIKAVNEFGAQVLILDDGFQHRRLVRDIDIVTIDATQPFGYDKILPAGLLREPVESLKRAHVIVLTRCDQVKDLEIEQLEEKLKQINPDLFFARSIHSAVNIIFMDKKTFDVEQLRDKKVFAFCGIGNPDAFFSTISSLGANIIGRIIYDDHHCYTRACMDNIFEQARQQQAEIILTTHKDSTKLTSLMPDNTNIPLAYLTIEIKFIAGEDKLRNLIEHKIGGTILKE